MQPSSQEPLICRVCGADLHPDHRYCPNCGTPTGRSTLNAGIPTESSEPTASPNESEPDPSLLETRRFSTSAPPPETHQAQWTTDPDPPPSSNAGAPLWGTPETTVAPESGNRTLWIILGIIAFIVLICCCLLPLGLATVSSIDSSFQDELRTGLHFTSV